jgi:hypothetical protein
VTFNGDVRCPGVQIRQISPLGPGASHRVRHLILSCPIDCDTGTVGSKGLNCCATVGLQAAEPHGLSNFRSDVLQKKDSDSRGEDGAASYFDLPGKYPTALRILETQLHRGPARTAFSRGNTGRLIRMFFRVMFRKMCRGIPARKHGNL